jgi:hypothetical protein
MPDLSGLTYSLDCDKRTGIKEVYIFKTTNVNTVTIDATSREITDITMTSTNQAYKIEIDDDESSYTGTMAGGYGTRVTSLLNLSIYKVNDSIRNIVQGWDKNACLAAIVVLYNGSAVCLGMDIDTDDSNDVYKWVKKLNASGTVGSGIVTDTGETATPKYLRGYQWTTNYEAPFVDSAFDYTTFTTVVA